MGSLQTKGNKYYAVLNVRENGKAKQKWMSLHMDIKNNRRNAMNKLHELEVLYEGKTYSTFEKILVSDYVRLWLKQKKNTISDVTYQGYEVIVTKHILPYFDNTKQSVQDVTLSNLQNFIDEKRINGRCDGKGCLSPTSLVSLKNILNQTFNFAIRNKIIFSNPCEFLVLPKKEKKNIVYYTPSQLKTLFEATKNEAIYPCILIAAEYGLRRSEILGIQWDSIDFENKTLTIKHTISKVTKAVAKDSTKNSSSYRSYPLTDEIIEIFQKAKEKENENRRLFGKAYIENNYVFKWDNGKQYHIDYISHRFSRILKKNGLPHIRFHDLRHSCASMLMNNGFTLKDVQEWLGHADIKTTANTYGHIDIERKKETASAVSNILCQGKTG